MNNYATGEVGPQTGRTIEQIRNEYRRRIGLYAPDDSHVTRVTVTLNDFEQRMLEDLRDKWATKGSDER